MGNQRVNQWANEQISEVKAKWTPEQHEMFVDLCLEQIDIGNRPGTHINREGWDNILDSFHTMTGLRYDKKQMKNHWDHMKKQWKAWRKLISTEGMKWDPDTRTFGATEEEWDDYIQRNHDAALFRSRELPFADKLDTLFAGKTDSGETETSNRKKRNNCSTGTQGKNRLKMQCYSSGRKPINPREKHNDGGSDVFVLSEEPVVGRPSSNLERCYDAVESRSIMTDQYPQTKPSYSIEECIRSLDTVEELEQGSELYLFALDVFLKSEYREIFLNLKKSSTKIAWLERLQSMAPTLPR